MVQLYFLKDDFGDQYLAVIHDSEFGAIHADCNDWDMPQVTHDTKRAEEWLKTVEEIDFQGWKPIVYDDLDDYHIIASIKTDWFELVNILRIVPQGWTVKQIERVNTSVMVDAECKKNGEIFDPTWGEYVVSTGRKWKFDVVMALLYHISDNIVMYDNKHIETFDTHRMQYLTDLDTNDTYSDFELNDIMVSDDDKLYTLDIQESEQDYAI